MPTAVDGPTLHAGRCIHCNYELRRLTDARCPECGNPFDPADEATVNLGRELTHTSRWVLAPGGRLMAVVIPLAAIAGMWFTRLPPGMDDRSRINGGLLIAIGLTWLAWPLFRRLVAWRNGWRVQWFVAGRRRPHRSAAIAVTAGLLIWFNIPRWLAFKISEPAMNAIAQQLIIQRKSSPKDQWLGIIPAKSIKGLPGGSVIFTTLKESHLEAGFVYMPKVDPNKGGWPSRRYVGNGWWTWREER